MSDLGNIFAAALDAQADPRKRAVPQSGQALPLLAGLFAGNNPADEPMPNAFQRSLPEQWKTEGWGPKPPPSDMRKGIAEMLGRDGWGTPSAPQVGYPLAGRSRMGSVPGTSANTIEQMIKQMTTPAPPTLQMPNVEQLAPRRYGRGQMI
jgi:hypothetical protein